FLLVVVDIFPLLLLSKSFVMTRQLMPRWRRQAFTSYEKRLIFCSSFVIFNCINRDSAAIDQGFLIDTFLFSFFSLCLRRTYRGVDSMLLRRNTFSKMLVFLIAILIPVIVLYAFS